MPEEIGRAGGSLRLTASAAAALLPAAVTVYLAFHSGGFFPGATSLLAAEMAILLAARLLLVRRPLAGASVPWAVATVALGALAAWTLLSAGWSGSPARALPEYTRVLLYALTLAFFGMMRYDVRRIRWMVYGLAAAIVAVCAVGLVARLLPQVIFDPALAEKERLGYPLTYWNSLGLLAGIGIVLCGHLACSDRDPGLVRMLGAAAVPLLALTLYYTLSRGAAWATVAALVVYVAVGRPRGLLGGALATVPATVAVLLVANPPDALTKGNPAGPVAVEAGRHVALVLLACIVAAAVSRGIVLPLDSRLRSFHLADRVRRPVRVAGVAVAAALLLAGAAAAHLPDVVSSKYRQFTSSADPQPGGGSSRLLSASTNGRKEHWDVALSEFRREPLKGSGAGTYALVWAKERPNTVHVEDAHSLYLETLGELGVVGFAFLAVALALILGAFAFRARGPDRAMFAALLAAGLAWATANGVDWDWEMPVTTAWLFAFGGAALASLRRSDRAPLPFPWRTALRVVAVVACLALAIVPARVAISASRFQAALEDFRGGDCSRAKSAARGAVAAEHSRAAPYTLVAFCDLREGRYRPALAAARAALAHDPRSWETNYVMAVARAADGLDPRAAAKRTARLNPLEPLAAEAPSVFRGARRREWILAGRNAVLPPPAAEDP